MTDQRTPLQEHIYHLTATCVDVITAADVPFQDATKLNEFKERLPDMVQAIHKAMHVVLAYQEGSDDASGAR
jgi:hypothetical protein